MNSLINKTILATTIALANGVAIREEAELTATQKAAQAAEIIQGVTPGISQAVANIVDAASGNVDGVCWKNSYVVRPELGNTCPDGWEKGGALCYEVCADGYQHDGPGGTICFKCDEEYRLVGGVCWKGWRSHIPRDTYNRGVGVQQCREGTIRQGALCYEEPTERFTLVAGVAWEHCTGDVPYNCGAMCT